MPTEAKAAIIDELTDKLQRARSAVLMQTEGMTVAELTEMRRKLAGSGIEMHIVKNTLLRIASERAAYQDLSKILAGQTTIALSYDDEVAPAKAVSEYLRTVRLAKPATIKAGILDHGPITVDQVEALSKVPPRDQLRAQVVGTVQGPLSQTYGVISAPLRDLINVLEARVRQLGEPAAA